MDDNTETSSGDSSSSSAEKVDDDDRKGKRKVEDTSPAQKKKGKGEKTDGQESLLNLLQSQQEMLMRSEENDRMAMLELMKFEVEAEKRHQEFTLAALKELGNIFYKKS